MMIQLQTMTSEETLFIQRTAHSQTTEARWVERAKIIWLLYTGQSAGEVAHALGIEPATLSKWLKGFNQKGS